MVGPSRSDAQLHHQQQLEPSPKHQSRVTMAAAAAEDPNGAAAPRTCWVCYGSEDDADSPVDWAQPCCCRGSSRWVHQTCLQKWVDVMQKGNINRKIFCPQCKTEYVLVFQSMGFFVSVLDTIEEITHKVCPFITGGVLLGSIYWTAITYGAVTVMQVLGHKDGLETLEASDPILLLLFLPAIPSLLICERALRWEEALLRTLHTTFPSFCVASNRSDAVNGSPSDTAPVGMGVSIVVGGSSSPTRILCSALILPTVSTLIGRLIFGSVRNSIHRAALGGLTFLLLRGCVTIYHKQKLLIRQSSKKILDYAGGSADASGVPRATTSSSYVGGAAASSDTN